MGQNCDPISLKQAYKSLAPSERGLSAELTGGVSDQRKYTPSTAARSPSLKEGGKNLW